MFITPKIWKSHREHTYKIGCRYSTGFYSVVSVVVVVVVAVVVVACTTSSGSTIGGSSSSSSSTYPMYDTEASVLGFPHRFSMYAQWKTSVLGFPHRFSMYAQCKTDQPKAFRDDMFGQWSNVKCTSDHNFKCTSDPNFKCTSDSSPCSHVFVH